MDALSPLGNNGPFSPNDLEDQGLCALDSSLFLYFTSNNSAPLSQISHILLTQEML